ncbi:MAG: ABC transporter substrate-binding protein [Nitrospinota bacterium]|jgi:peptide/nickel transport system substrate-binding protein|nr:ABC transporter substrate-binding protein [Nitrospinota bacterium]
MKSRWLIGLALVVFLVSTGAADAAPKGKMTFALAGSVKTFDPHKTTGYPLGYHYPLVFDTLVTRSPEGKLVGLLAKSWRLVSPKVVEFKLRKGIKFTNGEDVDAHAVKFSLERIMDPKLKSRQMGYFRSINRVEVVDKYTARLHTSRPDMFIIRPLAVYGQIVPPKYYKSKKLKYLARHPVGSGPYILKSWKKGSGMVYEANPNYWKPGVPRIKTGVIKIVPEPSTRVSALLAGDVDVADAIPPQMVRMVKADSKLDLLATRSMRTCYIYPIIKPGTPWEKKKVRQALNYAIDKDSLVKNVLRGRASVVATNVGPGSYGYNPAIKPYPYNPAKAKKLLAEAGYPNGFSVEMWTPLGRYLAGKQVSEAMQEMLAKVGIKANLHVVEYGFVVTKMRARWKPKAKSFLRFACRMDSNMHSEGMYAGTIHSRSTWGGYREKWMDKLIDDARSTTDDAKRLAKYRKINSIIHEEAILGFLYQQHQIAGKKKRVALKLRTDTRLFMHLVGWKQQN